MSRGKNLVVKTILDVGNPDSIQSVIDANKVTAQEMKKLVPEVLAQTQRNIRTRVIAPMLVRLRIYPPRQMGMPIRWKSEKQRKYVMWLLRKQFIERHGRPPEAGESIAYQRTFKFRDGWVSIVTVEGNKLVMRTENTAESEDAKGRMVRYQRFVTGDIGLGKSLRSIERYRAPMQPFHVDRGWQASFPLIQQYYQKGQAEAERLFEATLNRILAKRNKLR